MKPVIPEDSPALQRLFDEIRYRVQNDWDSVIGVTGYEGTGKSTLAWQACQLLNGGQRPLHGWTFNDIITLSMHAPPGTPILWDEGVEGLLSREAMTRRNKGFMKWMMVSRQNRLVTFVCFPRLANMDSYMREHRLWGHFKVIERGTAVLRTQHIDRDTEEVHMVDRVVVKFGPNTGPEWEAYKAKKAAFVRDQAESVMASVRGKA